MSNEKWVLSHGVHKGTLMSRDSSMPEEFDSEADALAAFYDHKKFYRSIGYVVWFATLKAPDGSERTIEQNSNYR